MALMKLKLIIFLKKIYKIKWNYPFEKGEYVRLTLDYEFADL